MLIALCFTSVFDFAGQTSTQTAHPVQSSGATWIVINESGNILRVIASVVEFNIAGDGPTQRLFPNLAFIALCVLILKLTWF